MDIRRLSRSEDNRIIGGVAGGIADQLGVSAAAGRILFVVGLLGQLSFYPGLNPFFGDDQVSTSGRRCDALALFAAALPLFLCLVFVLTGIAVARSRSSSARWGLVALRVVCAPVIGAFAYGVVVALQVQLVGPAPVS